MFNYNNFTFVIVNDNLTCVETTFLYNKHNYTWMLGNIKYIFRVEQDISHSFIRSLCSLVRYPDKFHTYTYTHSCVTLNIIIVCIC